MVNACKATLKADDILSEAKETIHGLHQIKNGEIETEKDFTEDELNKATLVTYAQTGYKLAQLYLPAVALTALGVSCIIGSHSILTERNVSLAAAYAAAQQSLKQYRKNVVDRYGEEVDKELRYGTHKETITETITDENGKKKKVKKDINVVNDPNDYSQYARFFDESSRYWHKDSAANLAFLNLVRSQMQHRLEERKFLFLNEVYEALDIPPTKMGQVVGWVYDAVESNSGGYVDFGVYNAHNTAARDFVNGYERSILLDFNIDGMVYDLM